MGQIEQGLYKDITNEDYHAGVGISKSGLDLIHRSPAHFMEDKLHPSPETEAMRIGTLAHMAILEPDRFNTECISDPIAIPKVDRRTKEGKAVYAAYLAEREAFIAENAGKTILPENEYNQIIGMRDAVYRNEIAKSLLTGAEENIAEASCYWYDEFTLEEMGVPTDFTVCKCRPDFLRSDAIVVDLKTTTDAREEYFRRSIATYRYHVQQAYYSDGLAKVMGEPVNEFVFIAVEKTPPYGVSVLRIMDESVKFGRDAYLKDLKTYIKCVRDNKWPCYEEKIYDTVLPSWAINL